MKRNKKIFKYIALSFCILTLITISTVIFVNRNSIKNLNLKSLNNPVGPETHSLEPIASNQWYSSIYNDFPTQPLFAFPMAYKISENGLSFSYPKLNKTPKTVFGSFIDDFSVGNDEKLSKPRIINIGDWNINVEMHDSKKNKIAFSLVQGLPYTIIESSSHNFTLKLNDIPEVVKKSENPGSELIFKVHGNTYGIATSKPANIDIQNKVIKITSTERVLVAILNQAEDINIYKTYVNNTTISTVATPIISDTHLDVEYDIYNKNDDSLMGLLPHQYNHLKTPIEALASYPTLRGDVKIYKMSKFTTVIDLAIPEQDFSPLSKNDPTLISQLKTDVSEYIKKGPPDSKNYFLGTWLGKGTSLYQLSDTFNENDLKIELFNYLYPIIEESMSEFNYNPKTTSVIAKRPEFGNEKNNDHHFHYSYYIRAAAVLAKDNPQILEDLEKPINQLVDDIATINRDSAKYPYLRNFGIYESHSWADGFAGAADGNNQESSSEAVNAWYSVYLWGKVTKNQKLSDYGLYLYNSEIQGTKYYWFGYNDVYTLPYQHAIASIVWGGKIDFATWFSDETNMKYGIQLLPITPGSSYLGTFTDFDKYEKDFLSSGGSISKSWGDLFLIWKSFYKPQVAYSEMNKAVKQEDNVPKSLLMYMLTKNSEK